MEITNFLKYQDVFNGSALRYYSLDLDRCVSIMNKDEQDV